MKEIAWKAQNRLHKKYQRLMAACKVQGKIVTAAGRELSAPMPGGSNFSHSLAMDGMPIATTHLSGDSTLVQKDQASGIDLSYLLPPRLPPLPTFFRVLFTGAQRFFYAANPAAEARPRAASY